MVYQAIRDQVLVDQVTRDNKSMFWVLLELGLQSAYQERLNPRKEKSFGDSGSNSYISEGMETPNKLASTLERSASSNNRMPCS